MRLRRFLRFLLRIQGAIVQQGNVLREEDAVEIEVRRHGNAKPRCPGCRKVLRGKITKEKVRWRHLDMMGRRTYVSCQVRQGRCPRHGRRLESVPWAQPRSRHTKDFDNEVARLAQVADKSATARMFDVSWRTVGRIVTRVVDQHLPKDLLDDLQAICVDETAYRRGHRYLTVVTCLITGRVVWLGKGNTAETLGRFFDELGPKRLEQLELVAMDMSGGYQKAVRERAPNVKIVFDRFHVVKLLLDAIDEIRRQECAKLEGDERTALKKTRFPLLRNPKHRKPEDLEAIRRVERTNRRLAKAYELRVSFEDLWESPTEKKAEAFLKRWTRSALLSRQQPLRRFARTIRKHMDGILAFIRYGGVTNAKAEGVNNKIQLLIHRAFGFHGIDALMAMVMLCCSGIDLPKA